LREIEALNNRGFEVITASTNFTKNIEKMSGTEKAFSSRTFYLKKAPVARIFFTLCRRFTKSPLKCLRLMKAAITYSLIKGVKSPIKALGYFVEAVLLVDYALKKGTPHVHVHFANPAATVALIGSYSGDMKYSLSVHGPDEFYNIEQNLLAEKVERATFVRCISHYCKSQLCRLIPYEQWEKLKIVRCGVDLAEYQPALTPANPIPQILCVGRLTRNKGQHILIEACARLKAQTVDFHLTFVGDGEDRTALTALAAKLGLETEIAFVGAMGREEVKTYYEKADIFVLPSFAEGVPVVLMEAMAMDIPVISTCITGIPELIESGVSGILTTPGDAEMLAKAIRAVMENPELRRQLGQKGRQKVAEAYDLVQNCKALSDIFRSELG